MPDEPRYRATLRPATPGEVNIIRAEASLQWPSYGCLFLLWLLPGLGAPLVGWAFGGWLGAVVGGALGIGALLMLLKSFRGFDSKRQARGKRDLTELQVECLEVETTHVVELDPVGDNDPALCFQIGPAELLLLQGQWLRDSMIYGAPERHEDPLDDRLNGLPDPFSFPSATFEMVRLRSSGRVLSLKPTGAYVPPRQVHGEFLDLDRHPTDSEILSGSLDRLEDAFGMGADRRK